MKKLFLLLAVFGLLFTACEEGGEEPEELFFALDKEEITINPDGGRAEVVVYSNYKWEISGTSDWCTPSVVSGEANENGQKVTFSADMTYDSRESVFWFRCADKAIKLVVKQSLKEVIIADDNNTFEVPAEGGTIEIAYQTNVECEVIIPSEAKSWITLAPETKGLVSKKTALNISENKTYGTRNAVIKVVAIGNERLMAEYVISQPTVSYIIKYTSSNGKIVTPYKSDAFGARILGNEYKDGVGYLVCDAPITSIGEDAFYGCSSLTSVTIPDSVTEIGYAAFFGCSSLISVTIPDSVTSIGDGAFYGCSSLTSVTIGDSVTEIGYSAFRGCSSLTSVTIPDSVTSIGRYAFEGCSSLTSVTIPDSVTEIGYAAFFGCSSLTSVTIPDSVTEIGGSAFIGCTGELIINSNCLGFFGGQFTKLTIGGSVTEIGSYAFYGCSSLTSVTIPDSVTKIGESAFSSCSSLTSVTIPDSVTEIGEESFRYCRSLTSVYCKPTTPPTGGYLMFNNNASGRKIYVPTESVSAYKSAEYWKDYASDIVGYDF